MENQLETLKGQLKIIQEKEKLFSKTYDRVNEYLEEQKELEIAEQKSQLSEDDAQEYQDLKLRYRMSDETKEDKKKKKKRRRDRKSKAKYTQIEDNPIDLMKENWENYQLDCGIMRNLKQEETKFDERIEAFHKQHPQSAKMAENREIQEEQKKTFEKLNFSARLASNLNIAGFLLIIIGVFVMNQNFLYSLVVLVPGFALVIYGMIKKKKVEDARKRETRNMKVNPGKVSKISEILDKRDAGEEKIEVFEEKYRSLLIVAGKGDYELLTGMTEIEAEMKRYKQLKERVTKSEEQIKENQERLIENQRELEAVWLNYFHERPEHPLEALKKSGVQIHNELEKVTKEYQELTK